MSRRERRPRRSVVRSAQEWRSVVNRLPPVELLDDEAVESIHRASLRILSDVGIDFLHPEALTVLRDAGASIDDQRVRLDPDLVADSVARAPASFRLHARNPDHDLTIGADHLAICTVASAPNVSDLERGRRPGNQTDFRDLVRLAQSFDVVHAFGGYPVEPIDLHPSTRHLDALSDFVRLSDKVFHAYALGRQRILDGLEIVRIGRGIDIEQLEAEPSLFTVVNTSSPLRLDGPMIEGLIEMARRNQVVVVTPFTLAGAMAPVSMAGALALQNAEALAGITLTQLVRPGAPVVYGGFTSNVDMRSGSPAFGTPEYVKAAIVGGQLARRYGVPYRSSNANASNAVDAQAAYESQMSLWGAVLGHANLLMHGAGWMEGGLVASFEKFMVDVEMLQMIVAVFDPVTVDSAELAVDAIAEVGPGGHFFGSAHTLERYERAFYPPLLSNWQSFESWQTAGAQPADRRAATIVAETLAAYEPPPLDPSIDAELHDFVERRRREGGVATD